MHKRIEDQSHGRKTDAASLHFLCFQFGHRNKVLALDSLPISWLADFGCGSLTSRRSTQQQNTSVGARGEKLNGKQQNNAPCALVFTFLATRVFAAESGFCEFRRRRLRCRFTRQRVGNYQHTREGLPPEREGARDAEQRRSGPNSISCF